MKNIEQFQPYLQVKQDMQMACKSRLLAYGLIQLLSIRPTMALAAFLGQDLELSNQAAMESWVTEQVKGTEGMMDEDLLVYLVSAFDRRMNSLTR